MQRSAPRFALAVTVGLLLATAVYLVIARGPALLLDLSTVVGMLCF